LLKIGQLASRIERNGRRRSTRRPKLSAMKESSAPGRRRMIKVKVKFTSEQATKAQRGSRGIALHSL